jgi:hypothetical protein
MAMVAVRFLRGHRNRPVLPHRQLGPMRDLLLSLAELARIAATQLDGDSRWLEAADALEAAAESLRRCL